MGSVRVPLRIAVLLAAASLPAAAPAAGSRAALPLRFEAGEEGKYFARCGNYRLFLSEGEVAFALERPSAGVGPGGWSGRGRRPSRTEDGALVRMRFGGGLPAAGSEALPGVTHYLIGDDRSRWRTSVPAYGAVVYRGVRPGVDLVFRGNPRDLEYDLKVAPGGDPSSLDFRFEGADAVEVDGSGDLVLRTPDGDLRHRAPAAWQEGEGGERIAVAVRWSLREDGAAVIAAGPFDRTRPLTVDPAVSYATYLGGLNLDTAWCTAVDGSGAMVIAGWTRSTDYPVKSPYQGTSGGGVDDAFVARISADGTTLQYATYLGGNGSDEIYALHLGADGSVTAGGLTASTNFPTVSPIQAAFGGGNHDAFLATIAPGGASLSYATYLGGSGFDELTTLKVDSQGRFHVSGATSSTNLPVVAPFQAAFGGGSFDGFTAILSSSGSSLLLASYIGGSGSDNATALGVDASGNTYLGGWTSSTNFPVFNALRSTPGGGSDDAFFAAVGPSGGVLSYATYFGGNGFDEVNVGTVDAAGTATFAGSTSSTNLPLATPFQNANAGGGDDAFIVRVNASGSSIVYASYFGANGYDQPYALALDASGAAYVGGFTTSTNLPLKKAVQLAYGGGTDDGFVVKVAPSGASTEFSTYLGGSDVDEIYGIALDGQGGFLVGGITNSPDFPVQGPVQGSFAGTIDSFVVRFVLVPPLAPSNLSAAAMGIAPVHLSWKDNSADEASFEIQRRVAPAPFAAFALAPADATSFDDQQTSPKTTYTYRVRAVSGEGVSAWSNEASATTLYLPAAPTGFTAAPVSTTGIDLAWTDASDNETGFEVTRILGAGSPKILATVPAGTTAYQDRALLPDLAYTYRLRATGEVGTSAYAPDAAAATPASLGLTLSKGKIADGPRFGKDKASVTLVVALLPGAPDGIFDPVADGLSLLVGEEGAPLVISVPPGEVWKERKGKFTWKTPRGSAVKASVVHVPATGLLTVKVSGAEFPAHPVNPIRVSLRGGDDGGSARGPWTTKKEGAFKYP